ncbi:E3 ubiquitin-protein ligase listerin [Rhizoctonia solani]|uniref:E3 ubiquitin-protein ligase listerin n=1 Tax=Rhizoctonia solani TaxID=456999 RepID=A0A0K6FX91_9AGAM|nr:E3 ubiquitin-protein ligase listerin [Rhizoctonia solani]
MQTPSQPGPSAPASPANTGNSRLTGLKKTLELLHAQTFSPIQAAVGDLASGINVVETATRNREDYKKVALELEDMDKLIEEYVQNAKSEQIASRMSKVVEIIRKEIVENEEDIVRRNRRIEALFRRVQMEALVNGWSLEKECLANMRLENLGSAKLARYNSSLSTTIKRRKCTKNTRVGVMAELFTWSEDPKAPIIFWMNGIAGTGKTTIAYTLAEELESRGQLAASFFCTRSSPECSDPGKIVPTIAYQLARQSTPFQLALSTILGRDPDIGSLNASTQFKLLLVDPLRDRDLKAQMPQNLVVVIDALDECSNGGAVEIILDMLFRFGEYLPLKFFLSSRPEPVIYRRMTSQNPNSRSTLHLHEIEKSLVEGDIVLYLTEELEFMSPPEDQISQLARLASNFFIYAATAVRYIQPGKRSVDPRKRLATMLDLHSTSTKKLSAIDLLYTAILEDAMDEDELEPEEKHSLLLVLWTVVCAREPITLNKLATLAGLSDMEEALATLQPLQSLLHVSEDSGMASTFHASFPDFMFDRERSKQFYCDEDQHRYYLASRCFEIMKAQLRFNICNLETSYLPDSEVLDLETRISQNISPDLDFACQHWEYYLQMSTPSKSLYDMLDDFLSNSLLFWMGVLNLKQYVNLGRSDIFGVGEWLKATGGPSHLFEFVADACQFIDFFKPCLISTPHLYVSALPLYGKSTPIFMRYSGFFQGFINIETIIGKQYQVITSGLDIQGNWPSATVLTYSDDGTCFGCIFDNGTLAVRSASDGAIIGSNTVPFESSILLLAGFSSDCRSAVITEFYPRKIHSWELHKPVRTITHDPKVYMQLPLIITAIIPLPENTGCVFSTGIEVFIYDYGKNYPRKASRLGSHHQGSSPPHLKLFPDHSRLIIARPSGEVLKWDFLREQRAQTILDPVPANETRLSQNCKFARSWKTNFLNKFGIFELGNLLLARSRMFNDPASPPMVPRWHI